MPYKSVEITTDGAGAGNADLPIINGEIISVVVDYDAGAAAGTDVTVTWTDHVLPGAALQIIQILNNNTDGIFYPRVDCNAAEDGTAIDYDPAGGPPNCSVADTYYVDGRLNVAIAQAGGATTNTIHIIYKADKTQI